MDKYLLKSENTAVLPDFSHPLIHYGITVSDSNNSSYLIYLTFIAFLQSK